MAELFLNLQLFADGSAPGSEAGAEQGETAATPTAQGETAATPTAEERRQAYERFKTDFEAEYKADMQNAVKERLKKSKAQVSDLQGRLDKLTPAIDIFASHYGVAADDIDSLIASIENDDKLYEEEAYDKGMTVEQYKEFKKLERQNQVLMRQIEAQREQEAIAERNRVWDEQFAELLKIYPNVDPNLELQNDKFVRLMYAGVPIRDAFELVHKEELQRGAMQYTANKTAEKLTNAAIANNAHPVEGGLDGQAAAVLQKRSISSLSLDEMKEINKRVRAGEKISFK